MITAPHAHRKNLMIALAAIVVIAGFYLALHGSGARSASPSATAAASAPAAPAAPSGKSGVAPRFAVAGRMRAAQERQARFRASAAAKRERIASRTKFHALSPRQALNALVHHQPVLAKTPAWRKPAGGRVIKYTSTTSALVDVPDTKTNALVDAVGTPIATQANRGFAGIDLSLESASQGAAPRNSAVDVLFPHDLAQPISVPSKDHSFTMTFAPAQHSAPSQIVAGRKAFYEGAAIDTDVVAEALPTGFEVSWALRSPSAPEALPLDVGADRDITLTKKPDGSVDVNSGSLAVANIARVTAYDAQQQPLAASYAVGERGLTVHIAHRGADVAYPIVVDPVVSYYPGTVFREADGSGLMFTGWGASANPAGSLSFSKTSRSPGYTFTITKTPNGQAGSGWWAYTPPNAATAFRAEFGGVSHAMRASKLITGLYNRSNGWAGSNWGAWTNGTSCVETSYGNVPGCQGFGGPFGNDTGMAYTQSTVACVLAGCGIAGSSNAPNSVSNIAAFQLYMNGVITSGSASASMLGGFIYSSDTDNPSMAWTQSDGSSLNTSGAWQRLPSGIKFNLADPGMGLGGTSGQSPALTVGVTTDGTATSSLGDPGSGPACGGGATSPCPTSWSKTLPTAQGERVYTATARDIVGHATQQTSTMRFDNTPPVIGLSGRFGAFAMEAQGSQTIYPRTLVNDATFVATATDGATDTAAHRQSGAVSLAAQFYKGKLDATGKKWKIDTASPISGISNAAPTACTNAASPTTNSCSAKTAGTFNASQLAPGVYYLRVTATDGVGLSSTKDFAVAVGIAEIASVTDGQSSSRYLPLQVKQNRLANGNALPSGTNTSAVLQFRNANNTAWSAVPASAVTNESTGATLSTASIPLTSGTSARWVVDLNQLTTTTGAKLPDGDVAFRALVDGTESDYMRGSEDVTIRYDHGGRDTQDATQAIGPGSVDLVTGNFSMSETDASVAAYNNPLTVSRTYNSRYGNDWNSVFGPGWASGQALESSGSDWVSLMDNADAGLADDQRYPFVEITSSDGSVISFQVNDQTNTYTAESGLESYELTRQADPNVPTLTTGFTLTDKDTGTRTFFTRPDAGAATGQFVPTRLESIENGEANSARFSYAFANGKSYVDVALAASGANTCSLATGDPNYYESNRGCRALKYGYTDINVQGNLLRRLTSVTLHAYAPELSTDSSTGVTCSSSTNMCDVPIARYTYDSYSRLSEAWDPRVSPALKTTYSYSTGGSGPQLLASVTPPGQQPYSLTYSSLAEDNTIGRLSKASRSALDDGTANWLMRYYVPTSGAGAPFDFSQNTTSAWGQENGPYIAAAVFTPDYQPSSDPPTAADYANSSLKYMDPLGRVVDDRSPGGRTSVTEYDKYGEVVRTLSAENLSRAMNLQIGGSSATAAQKLDAAERWDTESTYEQVRGTIDGQRHLIRTVGPEHSVKLSSGATALARTITQDCYDEGSPLTTGACVDSNGQPSSEGSAATTDPTTEPLGLLTTERESALVGSSATGANGAATGGSITDTRKSTTGYGTTADEWRLRLARVTATDPDGLNIVRKTNYDANGFETDRFQPRSQSASESSTTHTDYYTASGAGPCGGHPEWVGLACRVGPGAQPSTSALPQLPVKTITYNYLLQPLVSTETVTDGTGASQSRTSTATYDLAGRVKTNSITGTVGASVKTTSHLYDAATGLETQTQSLNSDGSVAKTITRVYDSLGRQINYTDSEGHGSAVLDFDILSRPLVTSDGKATRTNTYDPVTGDLSSVNDSGVGTISGNYDADGRLVTESLPMGWSKAYNYDAAGSLTRLAYTKTTNCSSSCTWFDNTAEENIHGQMVAQAGNLTQSGGATSQTYAYDAAGRLTEARDTSAGQCTIRQYGLDADSNRTSLKTYAPGAGGACDASGTPQAKNSTYDSADRLTNSGYTYDAFGRITTVPQADAGGSTDMTATYFVNDLAQSITDSGTTQTISLDPIQRMSVKVKTGGTSSTETYAYGDDSDSPAWIQTDSTWTRYAAGLDGNADLYQKSDGSRRVMIADIRGDSVAEGDDTTANQLREVDEFGVVKNGLPASRRYGFEGAHQREALSAGGTVAMGVRLYVPRIGRFLQVDPVVGGSHNPYDYAGQDPVGMSDLDGKRKKSSTCHVSRISAHTTGYVDSGAGVAVTAEAEANVSCRHRVRDLTVHVRIGAGGNYAGVSIPAKPHGGYMSHTCAHGNPVSTCSGSVDFYFDGPAPPSCTTYTGIVPVMAYATWTDSRGNHHATETKVDWTPMMKSHNVV